LVVQSVTQTVNLAFEYYGIIRSN